MSFAALHRAKIRKAQPWDYPPMRTLYLKSLGENTQGFVPDLSFHGDIELFAKQCIALGGDMLVAYHSGQLVGFGGIRPRSASQAELCKLHVNSRFQGKGYGKQLCKALMERSKKLHFDSVQLHVTQTQQQAIGLYKKLGFKQTHREMIHVHHNDCNYTFDTIFMEVSLLLDSTPESPENFTRALFT